MTRTMRSTMSVMGAVVAIVFTLVGCSQYQVIPDPLEQKVNKSVSFDQISKDPERYKGEVVVLGGEVLNVKRLPDKTRIEALALPLSEELVPMTDRSESRGRFYAFDGGKEIMDPKAVDEGTPITIVGEVTGSAKGTIDEGTYEYPTIRILDLTKWDKMERRGWGYGYPYYGGYYWGGYRPYGFYPYY